MNFIHPGALHPTSASIPATANSWASVFVQGTKEYMDEAISKLWQVMAQQVKGEGLTEMKGKY